MDIVLENDELILEKLAKLKCERGCQNAANYIVFEMGVYCTLCLSKLQDVPPTHLATFEDLSKVIADLAEQYQKNAKTGNNLFVLKAEAEQQNAILKPLRDRVTLDAKAIQSQANHIINNAETNCLRESRNQPLESYFEPDLTATILVNDSELFLDNLKNLKVQEENGKVSYVFKDASKNPEAAKAQSLKQIERISAAIGVAHNKARTIMSLFRESVKE